MSDCEVRTKQEGGGKNWSFIFRKSAHKQPPNTDNDDFVKKSDDFKSVIKKLIIFLSKISNWKLNVKSLLIASRISKNDVEMKCG